MSDPADPESPTASFQSNQADTAEAVEGRDYYLETNRLGIECLVFTAAYFLRRGYCCESGCRHCPYGFDPVAHAAKLKKALGGDEPKK